MSVIILVVAIDVGDTVVREKASIYYRINHLLKQEKLKPEQVEFYKCSTGVQEAMNFYFNRINSCTDDWIAVISSAKIKAVVTSRAAIEEDIPPRDIQNAGRVIYLDKGWVIYIKKN